MVINYILLIFNKIILTQYYLHYIEITAKQFILFFLIYHSIYLIMQIGQPQQVQQKDKILELLNSNQSLDSLELQKLFDLGAQDLYAILVSLSSINYIVLQSKKSTKIVLSKFGEIAAKQGSPEYRLFKLIPNIPEGIAKSEVQIALGDAYKIGFGNAMKKKLVCLKEQKIFRVKNEYEDQDKEILLKISHDKAHEVDKAILASLKTRKLTEEKSETSYIIKKGAEYKTKTVVLSTQITSNMIANDSWETASFKTFNPEAKGVQIANGNLHVLMKTRDQFKQILIEMGFQEMETDRYVQSSFWNFDALFQPQAHPARDAHDTFFISDPKECTIAPQLKEYFQDVKNIHEKGGYGSTGYNCVWQESQAKKNILRTHTTAISTRTLKRIAQDKPFRSRKFFSIDRVFRNQTLDNTHLAEFHQVQGFIIDRNLGLQHLIGILTEFYKKIGIQKIWLKPTYNPYTQPSMEIYGLHPILKKRVQMGNSGIFRPEMLRPMGFPEDVSVIAWGLGLQRPTMIQFGISNIKELFGPSVSIKKVKDSAIYCL